METEKIAEALDALEADDGVPFVPPALMPVGSIEPLATASKNCVRKIRELVAERNRRIESIKGGRHRPEIEEAKIKIVESEIGDEVARCQSSIGQNAETARRQRKFWNRSALFARTPFDTDLTKDATIRLSLGRRLSRCTPARLLQHAELFAGQQNPAAAGALADEMDARSQFPQGDPRHMPREYRARIEKLIDSVPLPQAEAVGKLLDEIEICERRAKIDAGDGTSRDRIALGLAEEGLK